tara:strand:+ start:1073 stop:1360 length:288 start_codon:yes stop_codon:yes gene_type:complete
MLDFCRATLIPDLEEAGQTATAADMRRLVSIAETKTMHATVTIKTIYGQDRVYPANDVAYALAALLGSKTFTREQIAKAKALGYTFEIKAQEHVL